jgi:heme exporter protein B
VIAGWSFFKKQCQRELLLCYRQSRYVLMATLFFFMLIVFFPLTLQPEQALLRAVLPGMVWIAMLLALLISAESMFQQDYEQGVLEQWLVSGESLSLMVTAKIVVHWLGNLVPMLLLSPLIALLFSLSLMETLLLALSLLAGTPALVCLCALATAFSLGTQQKGAMMMLILLPLTLPILIFGSSILSFAMQGAMVSGYLAILLALSILACSFLPLAIASVIRIGLVA